MENDKLKDFIKTHREFFEMESPERDIWYRIENKLPAQAVIKKLWWAKVSGLVKIAASVILLLGIGLTAGVQMNKKQDISTAIQDPVKREEFKEAEVYYTGQISQQMQALGQYADTKSILDDLNQIDQISTELKLELLKNPDQDQGVIVEEMIKQYHQKLEVLNKILIRIQENPKTNSNINSSTKENKNDTL